MMKMKTMCMLLLLVAGASAAQVAPTQEVIQIAKIAENTQAIGELAGETEGLQLERESSSARTSSTAR